jgi:hypothetical protein
MQEGLPAVANHFRKASYRDFGPSGGLEMMPNVQRAEQ